MRLKVFRMIEESHRDTAILSQLLAGTIKAARRTPYGKDRSAVFTDWPTIHKADLRGNADKFRNPSSWLQIPAGTGGTTGIPVKLWRSPTSIVAEQAFLDNLLKPHGFTMHRSRVAVLRADNIKSPDDHRPPFGRISHGGRRLTFSTIHLSSGTVGWFCEALKDFKPDILWIYPNAGVSLLSLMKTIGFRLKIPLVLASSEILLPDLHRSLTEYFSGTVIDYYGQTERVCFAWSVTPGEFYFEPSYGHVELQKAANDGDATLDRYRIIGTNYWNAAMPLVRYDTEDFIYVPAGLGERELAEIAVGKRPFTGLSGRDGEYFLTREGVRIIGLNHIPKELNNVYQIQLVQPDYDRLIVNVIAAPDFGDQDVKQIIDQVRLKIPTTVEVSVRAIDSLIKTQRGKTPLICRTF